MTNEPTERDWLEGNDPRTTQERRGERDMESLWQALSRTGLGTEQISTVLRIVGRDLAPEVGSVWEWEPLAPHARQTVRVTEVRWNGEEWWVESELVSGGGRYLNSLGRWVEATVLVAPAGD